MSHKFRDRIDVHHHVIPAAFAAAAKRHGLTKVAGAELPSWSARRSLDMMDMNGIRTAILSLSTPGVNFGDRGEARDLARACNEEAASVISNHPGRFGSFAVLPMPFADDSAREAEYALDTLGADGVVLLGSTNGVFLGDPRLDELMAELDRRHAIVFIHPNIHPTSENLGLEIPGFFVEFLCDTTRAATNLIMSGTLERYPNIRFILAHAGGFLPYIAWRLSLANEMPKVIAKAPKGILHYIRTFYFDTALSPSPFALAALRRLVDPGHILFGSDFPFAPAIAVGMEIKSLEALEDLTESEKAGIDRSNALALFPRLILGSAEDASPGLVSQIRGAVAQPLIDIADRIRDR